MPLRSAVTQKKVANPVSSPGISAADLPPREPHVLPERSEPHGVKGIRSGAHS
jgi:hypothetical protein